MNCCDEPIAEVNMPQPRTDAKKFNVIGWKAWYVDGQWFTSRETKWEDLPDDGVAVVMLYFEDGTRRIVEDDWYFKVEVDGKTLYGQDGWAGSRELIQQRYPGASVKRGKWTADEIFFPIEKQALDDLVF